MSSAAMSSTRTVLPAVTEGKPRKPHYARIHAQPVPLNTYPLPAFHPSNPISLLRFAYALLSSIIFRSAESSHPQTTYHGTLSPSTHSVHITDYATMRALWEHGFFGSGNLSRSEPVWLAQEQRRQRKERTGPASTSEENTRNRREARRDFKQERARQQNAAIEEQLRKEAASPRQPDPAKSGTPPDSSNRRLEHSAPPIASAKLVNGAPVQQENDPETTISKSASPQAKRVHFQQGIRAFGPSSTCNGRVAENPEASTEEENLEIENQEHLQLTFEEAFYLSYGLGVLGVGIEANAPGAMSNLELLHLLVQHSRDDPSLTAETLRHDDMFLYRYAVYHHFRSLGWVVRAGIKFSTDLLLYNRGPVFAHAQFAVVIVPVFRESGPDEASLERARNWWWLHCVNRVQAQVLKHLVLAYVEVPTQSELDRAKLDGIGAILRGYRVREFVLRRWNPNRNRS